MPYTFASRSAEVDSAAKLKFSSLSEGVQGENRYGHAVRSGRGTLLRRVRPLHTRGPGSDPGCACATDSAFPCASSPSPYLATGGAAPAGGISLTSLPYPLHFNVTAFENGTGSTSQRSCLFCRRYGNASNNAHLSIVRISHASH